MEFNEELRKMIEQHDKEVQDKAIDEFAREIWSWCFEHGRKVRVDNVKDIIIALDSISEGIDEILKQMKTSK